MQERPTPVEAVAAVDAGPHGRCVIRAVQGGDGWWTAICHRPHGDEPMQFSYARDVTLPRAVNRCRRFVADHYGADRTGEIQWPSGAPGADSRDGQRDVSR